MNNIREWWQWWWEEKLDQNTRGEVVSLRLRSGFWLLCVSAPSEWSAAVHPLMILPFSPVKSREKKVLLHFSPSKPVSSPSLPTLQIHLQVFVLTRALSMWFFYASFVLLFCSSQASATAVTPAARWRSGANYIPQWAGWAGWARWAEHAPSPQTRLALCIRLASFSAANFFSLLWFFFLQLFGSP